MPSATLSLRAWHPFVCVQTKQKTLSSADLVFKCCWHSRAHQTSRNVLRGAHDAGNLRHARVSQITIQTIDKKCALRDGSGVYNIRFGVEGCGGRYVPYLTHPKHKTCKAFLSETPISKEENSLFERAQDSAARAYIEMKMSAEPSCNYTDRGYRTGWGGGGGTAPV
jgi:hypothetical protein